MGLDILRPWNRWRIGDWKLLAGRSELVHVDGSRRRLTPQMMTLLILLLQRRDEVVSREALLDAYWGAGNGSDEALTKAISDLRRLLGDTSGSPRYIRTVPRLGYRLVAPVSAPATSAVARRPPRGWLIASVVVLVAGMVAIPLLWPPPAPPRLSELRPITSDERQVAAPVFGADGTTLYYSAHDGGSWDIYRYQDGISTPLLHSPLDEFGPAPGPLLAFSAYSPAGACAVVLLDEAAQRARPFTPCLGLSLNEVDWAPDGRSMAVSWAQPGRWFIKLVDYPAGTLQTRLAVSARTVPIAPAFDRGGHRIAFLEYDWQNAGFTPAVVDRAAGTIVRFGEHTGGYADVDWLSDHELVLAGQSGNREGVRRLDLDTRELSVLSHRAARSVTVSPDGRQLALALSTFESDLFFAPAPEQPLVRIGASTWNESQPALSPDGSQVAFVSWRTGAPQMWLTPTDGGDARQLTHLAHGQPGNPAWSPDGTSLVYSVRRPDGGWQSWRHEVAENVAQPLPLNAQFISWTRDGEHLLHSCHADQQMQVCVSTADGTDTRVLTRDGGAMAVDGGDGFVYYSRLFAPGLYRVPLGGGEATAWFDRLPPYSAFNWVVAGDHVYHLQLRNGAFGSPSLVRSHVGQAEPVVIRDRVEIPHYYSRALDLSRTGSFVVVNRTAESSDIVLANVLR